MPDLKSRKSSRAALIKFIDAHRAALLFAVLFTVFSAAAPNFINAYNVMTIFQGATLNAIVAVGFTVIFILKSI